MSNDAAIAKIARHMESIDKSLRSLAAILETYNKNFVAFVHQWRETEDEPTRVRMMAWGDAPAEEQKGRSDDAG